MKRKKVFSFIKLQMPRSAIEAPFMFIFLWRQGLKFDVLIEEDGEKYVYFSLNIRGFYFGIWNEEDGEKF